MPYTHITWGQLQTALAIRLGDSERVFWHSTELIQHLTEALRALGVLAGFWRARGRVPTVSGQPFYDIPSGLDATGVVDYTVTDRALILQLQTCLLEKTTTQSAWPGTAQFSYAQVSAAVLHRRNRFLADTGVVITHSALAVPLPVTLGRVSLPDAVIDARRIAWVADAPASTIAPLWREDETAMGFDNAGWAASTGVPQSYAVMAAPPVQIQLNPPPAAAGSLDLLTVKAAPDLAPDVSETILGIPDDLTPAIKWGALADLLGGDGDGQDTPRAVFAEQRYQQYVALAKALSLVVNAELDGVTLLPATLHSLDAAVPDWQDALGTPTDMALAGWNLLALSPVPDGTGYVLNLDVVSKAPIPSSSGQYVQVGREQVEMLLDYAEHLALFKTGGQEWAATAGQAKQFLVQAMSFNRRLSAQARYVIVPKEQSQRELQYRARIREADALGALPSGRGPENA